MQTSMNRRRAWLCVTLCNDRLAQSPLIKLSSHKSFKVQRNIRVWLTGRWCDAKETFEKKKRRGA